MAASVANRLLNLSAERKIAYQHMLLLYANERFLYRLTRTKYANKLILKGGLLFFVWQSSFFRPTRDMDFLMYGDVDQQEIERFLNTVCKARVEDDGLSFALETIRIKKVREQKRYFGFQISLKAYLSKIEIPVRLDIGIGDMVTPSPYRKSFPVLLPNPEPQIMVYPPETSIAEKLQNIVELGMANSRIKDYFDIYYLLKKFTLSRTDLKEAIRNTFSRRGTAIPITLPFGLSDAFAGNPQKNKQWKAFLKKNDLNDFGMELPELVKEIKTIIWPIMRTISREKDKSKD